MRIALCLLLILAGNASAQVAKQPIAPPPVTPPVAPVAPTVCCCQPVMIRYVAVPVYEERGGCRLFARSRARREYRQAMRNYYPVATPYYY